MASQSTIDLSSLQNASRVLIEQFTKDSQTIPDLGDSLGGQASSSSYSVIFDDRRTPYQKRKLVGIPESLFQYYSTTNVNSHMGLIPQIERAWISIDHKLFLWDYVDGQDISSFVDQPSIITHVALVKPKKSLFIDEIAHLLVICTPSSVLLIGVSSSTFPGSSSRTRKEIKLYATDLTVPTEIEMTSVAGTSDGRIFMCGSQDGCLYELHYQETESWFGKRVQLINHSVSGVASFLPKFNSGADDRIVSVVADIARNCLYTLTEQNTISVFQPTVDKTIQHTQTLSNIYKAAQDKAPGSPALTPQTFQIISLQTVDPSDSRSSIHLIAVTTNGTRLYFSSSISYGYYASSNSTRALQLQHVRLPPASLVHPDEHSKTRPTTNYGPSSQAQNMPASRPYVVSAVDMSCYSDGLTIAAQPGDVDGTDYLLCLAPDLTRIGALDQLTSPQTIPQQPTYSQPNSTPSRIPLTEHATVLPIPGRTWAMASLPSGAALTPSGTPLPTPMNELAFQFSEPPRQFIILTNVGLTFLVKRRALDYLKDVIEEIRSEGNVQSIIEFRDSFGRAQTCAMLLGLASGNTFIESTEEYLTGNIGGLGADVANVAKQAFYELGERPVWTERVVYGKEPQGQAIFSGRRDGLALYLARLVRPIWKSKVIKSASSRYETAISEKTIGVIQKNLYGLKDFLDHNPQLFHSPTTETAVNRAPSVEQQAWKAEQTSVTELVSILSRTIEALAFILLLNDHRLGELITRCDADIQKMIEALTFEDLITTQNGMTISRALVNVIIDKQIGQQISVDTVSEVLQRRCGSFCSADDVMLYKAKENIKKALETRNINERQNWLAEALRLYLKGARILALEKLQEICGDFQLLRYARGAIELPLACAEVADPNNLGFEYWQAGAPANDTRADLLSQRLSRYDLVLDSLLAFESLEDDDSVRSHAYELAFGTMDEIFHSRLYDWLISRDRADDLLDLRPSFLESYLRRDPVTVEKYQLLWQFYVKDGQPLRAAEVLGTLAESTQFDLDIGTRLECLTLAVGNAKSHPISSGGRHETAVAFLTDLEEKLDVAQVQLEIYNLLLPHLNDAVEVGSRIKLLSTRLFTMSELFQEYAVPFDLPAMKLLCLHVSEHHDESVVRPIWNQIFNDVMDEPDAQVQADLLVAQVIPLGQRFYPSESAFPLNVIADMLVRFELDRKEVLPSGWAPRVLIQSGVAFNDIWDVIHQMYESQIPPFNAQQNVQTISSDIAVLLRDWLQEAKRPNSRVVREEIPVGRIDAAVEQYLKELDASRVQTKNMYDDIRRDLRRNW